MRACLSTLLLLGCARRPPPETPDCPLARRLEFPAGSEAGKALSFAGDGLLVGAPEEAGGGAAYLFTAGETVRLSAPGFSTVGRAVLAARLDPADAPALAIGGLDPTGQGVVWLSSGPGQAELGSPALYTGADGRGLSLAAASLGEAGSALLLGLPRAAPEGEIRLILPGGPTHRLRGAQAHGFAGSAALGEDLDGDGLLDLAIGAWGEAGAGPRSGAVYLVQGPIEGDGGLEDAIRLPGEAAWDLHGWALAAADLDRDGRADLLVGAPGVDGAGPSSGGVYLHPGEASLAGIRPAALALGPSAGARAGWALAVSPLESALLVGAPGHAEARGAVLRIEGPLLGVHSLSQPLARGEASGGLVGSSLALGPIDPQGCRSLAIGAPGEAAVLLFP